LVKIDDPLFFERHSRFSRHFSETAFFHHHFYILRLPIFFCEVLLAVVVVHLLTMLTMAFSTRTRNSSNPKGMLVGAIWALLLITVSAWTNPRICSNRAYRSSGLMGMASEDASIANANADCNNDNDTRSDNNTRQRRKIQLNYGKDANILSRTVPLSDSWNVTVWEWEKPAAVVETFWQVENQGLSLTRNQRPHAQTVLDPFGLVSWPGAVVAVQELSHYPHLVRDKRVLILGAGVGIEAQAAAMLGAASVTATDIHPTTLKLLQYGVEQAGFSNVIETAILDLCSDEPLPACDLIIVADVLYNERLAAQVAVRCLEARQCDPPPVILVSDSQRFVHKFEADLNNKLKSISDKKVAWENRWLPNFTGSGVLIDVDQTYDVKARVLWMGLIEEEE
jgi:predicted nicotinamide N-methyase